MNAAFEITTILLPALLLLNAIVDDIPDIELFLTKSKNKQRKTLFPKYFSFVNHLGLCVVIDITTISAYYNRSHGEMKSN